MKTLINLLLLFSFFTVFSQENKQIKDSIGKDILDNSYFVIENTLYKKAPNNLNSYKNISLGDITSIDLINSLEIVLFYSDFNSVIILDNQLNVIENIQFQDTILFVKKGITNKLWIYNYDARKIQLYDYKIKKATISSQVITDFEPIKMDGDFNSVRLIGANKTLVYNQYLNLIDTINH
ncbi:hypothetical protein [Urechidicola croceus]|uniref:Uncharacterized protein n=1 Tax=Urechidicola croceus TaxID=1850246 RepID=A0A1D8P7T6_9FLAO|nr:hypothetical protein [Urechidicola croceus]AOW20612.1 hypothetical protein LPB138_07955 [Urechidicola croceus]